MRQPTTWTSTRNEQLKQLVTAGHTAAEIAVTLGTTAEAIKTQRQRLGLTAKTTRNPVTYRIAALVRMIEAEDYPAHRLRLRRRLLGAMAEKNGLGGRLS